MHGDTLGNRRRIPPQAIKQSGYECNKKSEHQTLDLSTDETDKRGLQMADQNPTRGGGDFAWELFWWKMNATFFSVFLCK